MMLTEYSPGAAAYAVRCKTEALRDWRRLGFFNGLGERRGRVYYFTESDIGRIAVAAFIARHGASLREAFAIVGQRGTSIDAVVARERAASGAPDYFLSFTINPDCSFPESITGAPISRISFDIESTAALQLNVSKLVRSALERLDTNVKNAFDDDD